MAAGGVRALEFVVDFRRGAEIALKVIGPDQRGGAVHSVEILNFLRDLDEFVRYVELLVYALVAEHGAQIVLCHRLAGAGVENGVRLFLHESAQILPRLGHLVFADIDFVGYFAVHSCALLSKYGKRYA